MDFSERLKQLRKERGYKQSVVAHALNYGYTAIANYESGRNQPSINDLIRLAELFDVTVDYLVGASDFSEKSQDKLSIKWKIGDKLVLQNGKEILIVRDVLVIDSLKSQKSYVKYVMENEESYLFL